MEQVRGTWKLLSFVIFYRQSDANQTTDTTEQQSDKGVHREVTVQIFFYFFIKLLRVLSIQKKICSTSVELYYINAELSH